MRVIHKRSCVIPWFKLYKFGYYSSKCYPGHVLVSGQISSKTWDKVTCKKCLTHWRKI